MFTLQEIRTYLTHKAKEITDKETKIALRYWSETLKRVVSAYNTKLAPSHRTNKAALRLPPLAYSTCKANRNERLCRGARTSHLRQRRGRRERVVERWTVHSRKLCSRKIVQKG